MTKNYKNGVRPGVVAAGIIVVIGLLASICAVFPEDGISVTEAVTLRFPTLAEMLQGDSIPQEAQLSPEELLALRQQEMKMQEEKQYIDYFASNPTRIHFPAGDITYFDAVYEALEHAYEKAVRVVHFGDSQLEEDRMSCNLRLALQSKFGGGGNGLIPWQESLYSQTINLGSAHAPQRYQVYGPKSNRRDSSRYYGPMGNVSILDTTMTVSVTPKKRNGELTVNHYFNRLTILSQSGQTLQASVQGQHKSITPANTSLQFTTFELKDSTTSFSITLSGNADIYGLMLDMNRGVSVDNIPMRGCSGTIFGAMDATQLITYFRETNTRLIIMQFGGNSMPYMKDQKGIDRYVEQLRRQVQLMKRYAPEARILWVGPSDMTTRINGKMQTYPLLSAMDRSICQMVNEEGCAYWSLFESMGGTGSMVRWANAQPPLAGKDYVHFTRLGATRAGELLTKAFLTGYDYYSFRHPQLPEPTVAIKEPLPPLVITNTNSPNNNRIN